MLLSFSFSNFKSYAERQTLSMEAVPRQMDHLEGTVLVRGERLLTVAAIHGNNASGKSGVVEAFDAMEYVVTMSAQSEKALVLLYNPNCLQVEKRDEPTTFEVELAIGVKKYRYGFSFTEKAVVKEWLYESGFSKQTKNREEKALLLREGQRYKAGAPKLREFINERTLVISMEGAKGQEKAPLRKVFRWLEKSLAMGSRCQLNRENAETLAKQFLNSSKEKIAFHFDLIGTFDPCLLGFFANENKEKEDETKNLWWFGVHRDTDGKKAFFPFRQESEGTQRLFTLEVFAKSALENGNTFFIDELDASLHPLVLRRFIQLFKDPEINKAHAQLVFTSHSDFTLDPDLMRRDEIWFCEKDAKGTSELYSLAEFKERSDRDYPKSYYAGRYGAIPYQEDAGVEA